MKTYYYSYCASRVKKRKKPLVWIGDLVVFLLDMTKSCCFGALAGLSIISVLSFTPSLFMEHSFERDGIQLLSDRPLGGNSLEIISRTQERISASELYRPDMKFKVYLCNQHWAYLLASRFSMDTKGVYVTTTDRIIIDMKSMSGNNDLVRCVAHELTHAMVRDKIGWRVLIMPDWVSEGYAEYVAKGIWTNRDARSELLRLQSGNDDPDSYGQYRLLVTYALDVWSVPLDNLLLNPPATRELIFTMQSQSMDWLMSKIIRKEPMLQKEKILSKELEA